MNSFKMLFLFFFLFPFYLGSGMDEALLKAGMPSVFFPNYSVLFVLRNQSPHPIQHKGRAHGILSTVRGHRDPASLPSFKLK